MAGKLSMRILSPLGVQFEGDVLHASFPGTIGAFAIFPGHAPLISSLKNGTVKYTLPDGDTKSVVITGGFAEVSNDRITVCVETEGDNEN